MPDDPQTPVPDSLSPDVPPVGEPMIPAPMDALSVPVEPPPSDTSSPSRPLMEVSVPTPTPDVDLSPAPAELPPSDTASPSTSPKEVSAPAPQADFPHSLEPQPPADLPPAPAEPPPPSGPDTSPPPKRFSKKNSKNMFVLISLLFLLITSGFVFIFVNQKTSLNDIRNRAVYPTDPCASSCTEPITNAIQKDECTACRAKQACAIVCSEVTNLEQQANCDRCSAATSTDKQCLITNGNDSCPSGQQCHCQDGNACTKTACEADTVTYNSCLNQGRSWCINQWGYAHTCCAEGYICGRTNGCFPKNVVQTPADTNTPTPTNPAGDTPGNTPTNTPIVRATATNSPTPTATLTPTNSPTATLTPTLTPTPTPPVGCNNTCADNSSCVSGLVCSGGFCRTSQCVEKTNCLCNVATPTPTPNLSSCNNGCTVNTDCSGALVCIEGSCRNASCAAKTTCVCDVAITAAPTPKTPVAGTGPSVLGATAIAGGFFFLLLGLLF